MMILLVPSSLLRQGFEVAVLDDDDDGTYNAATHPSHPTLIPWSSRIVSESPGMKTTA